MQEHIRLSLPSHNGRPNVFQHQQFHTIIIIISSFTLRVCQHLKTSSPTRKQRTCVTLSLCPKAVTLSGRRGSAREPHWRSQSAWTRVYKGGRRVQKREESASVFACVIVCQRECETTSGCRQKSWRRRKLFY